MPMFKVFMNVTQAEEESKRRRWEKNYTSEVRRFVTAYSDCVVTILHVCLDRMLVLRPRKILRCTIALIAVDSPSFWVNHSISFSPCSSLTVDHHYI